MQPACCPALTCLAPAALPRRPPLPPSPGLQDGVTPLFMASQKGLFAVVEQLLIARADVNAANNVS